MSYIKVISRNELETIENWFNNLQDQMEKSRLIEEADKIAGRKFCGKTQSEFLELIGGIKLAMNCLGFEFVRGDVNGVIKWTVHYRISQDYQGDRIKPQQGFTIATIIRNQYEEAKYNYEKYERELEADGSRRDILLTAMEANKVIGNNAKDIFMNCALSDSLTLHKDEVKLTD